MANTICIWVFSRKKRNKKEGEAIYENVSQVSVSRGHQINIEVKCSHRMSVNVLRSRCTTNIIETKLFSQFTGFIDYSQFIGISKLDRRRGTSQSKAGLVDASLLSCLVPHKTNLAHNLVMMKKSMDQKFTS